MIKQKLKEFIYKLDIYVPNNNEEMEERERCFQKLDYIECIFELKDIDQKRFYEMMQILENQSDFLSYATMLTTLISLVYYNVAIISYSKEELFLAIQSFKGIEPSSYHVYDNKGIPLLSNRMYLNNLIETYTFNEALETMIEYLDGCEVSYQSGVIR